jgi:acetyl-CoA carboxylase carboxyltransferase component
MTRFQTRIQPQSDAFVTNKAANDRLVETLQTRMAQAIGGGADRLRQRHRGRGKLLARDRIDRVIDPGTAFLELSPLAAWGQYDGDVNAAGVVTGLGVVHGQPVTIIANDATVKGGSFFHETVKKHARAQEIAEANRLPVSTWWIAAGPICPSRTGCFLTGTISEICFIASAGCRRRDCRRFPWCSVAVQPAAPIFRRFRTK